MTFTYNPRSLIDRSRPESADQILARVLGNEEDDIDLIPFDEEQAEQQGEARRFDSAAPTGADYSAEYLNDVRRNALRKLSDPEAEYTAEEIERLQQIAATGTVEDPDTEGFWTTLLDAIDIPGRMVRLAIADAFQLDQKSGVEIDRQAYQSALNPFDNPSDLADILGEDFVGEDGRFGGSKLIETLGWDPEADKPGWSGFGRFLADFGAEVLLDPLTYASFGVGGLGKAAATDMVGFAVRRGMSQAAVGTLDDLATPGVREAAQAVANAAPEAGTKAHPFVNRLTREVADETNKIFRRRVKELGGPEEYNKLGFHEVFALKEEVADEAFEAVSKRNLNDLGEKVVNKRFDELPDDFRAFVQATDDLDNRQLGGLRLNIPRLVGGGGAPGGVGGFLPGGARKTRETIKRLPVLNKAFNSRIFKATGETLSDIAKKFGNEQSQIVAARNGELWEQTEAVRRMERRMRAEGVEEITPRMHAKMTTLTRAAKGAGENADDVVRKVLDRAEGLQAKGVAPLFDSDDLNNAAAEFINEWQEMSKRIHTALSKLDPSLGSIQGYVPRILSPRGRKALEYLAEKVDDPAAIEGTTLGHQMLKALLADQKRNVARRTGKSVGEATHTRTRELFGNAVALLDEAGHALINGDIGRGFPSISELNEQLGKAIRDVAERNSLPIRLGDDLKVWDDNPQSIFTNYFRGMEQALRERALIKEWQDVGLIRPENRQIDVWRTVDKIRGAYNEGLRKRISARYDALRETVERTQSVLEGVEDVKRTTVKLGQGVEVELPEAVVEMPRVQRAIGKAQEKLAKAAEYRDEIVAAQKATYNELMESGVSEPVARQLALARPSEVSQVKRNVWNEAIQGVADDLDYITQLISREYSTNKTNTAVLRQLALDQASHHRQGVRNALDDLDRQWRAKFLDEIEVDEVSVTHTMTPTDIQAFGQRAEAKLAKDADTLLADLDAPDNVKDSLRRAYEAGGHEGLMVGLRRYADVEAGARMVQRQWELIESVASDFDEVPPIFAKVLDSRRNRAVYNRAKRWLEQPYIEIRGERDEQLLAEFMWRDLGDDLTVDVQDRLFDKPDFLRAAGAAYYQGAVKNLDIDSAKALAEFDSAFEEFALEMAQNATKRDREAVVVDALKDHLTRVGQGEIETFYDMAEHLSNNLATQVFRHNPTLAMLRQVGSDPRLAQTDRFKQGFVNLAADMGFDPDLIAFSDEGVHILARKQDVADFPTLDEIMVAVREVAGDDATYNTLTAAQKSELPDRIRQALDADGVPEHIQQHERLAQWYAAARRESARGGVLKRKMNAIDASERVWKEDVLPELRKVLSGKRKIATLRKKLYFRDERTGMELTDLGRTLKRGMPDGEWDRLVNQLDYLELASRPNVPRTLLAANQKLLDGTAFKPFSQSIEKLQNLADDIALDLTEQERRRAEGSLSLLDELVDTLREDIFPKGLRDRGPGVRPELPGALFAEESGAFDKAVKTARTISKRLGLDDDADVFKAEKTTTKLIEEHKNYAPLTTSGIGGEAAQGLVGTEAPRIMLANMAASYKALATPEGLEGFSRAVQGVVRWWKPNVTITRPTFHTRNLIGGVWNNQIADVGMREYALVGRHAPKFLFNLRRGMNLDEALARLPNADVRDIFRAMVDSKVLENSFARREFGQVGTRRARMSQRVNPADAENFFLVHGGVYAMETVEGFLRAAAFARYYKIGNPDSIPLARSVVNAVHFDYSNLSELESAMKKISPFFVWTRRNIPLQLRALIERPGIMSRYESLMNSISDQAPELPQDRFPSSPYLSPLAAKTGLVMNADTPFWARMILDPDIPTRDIMEIDPLSPSSWMNFVFSGLGPQFTLPINLREQAEYGDVNAPTGLAEILKPFVSETESGDVRIPYWARSIFEFAVPYYREYVGPVAPRDPRRAQRFGLNRNEEIGADDRIESFLRSMGRAGGVQFQTPADAPSHAFQSQQEIRDIDESARLEGRIQPEEEDGFDVDELLASLDI